MDGWIEIERWRECAQMAKPGVVFELRNAAGQSLFTPCTSGLPHVPFDWKLPAIVFRAVAEPAPRHSSPLPNPAPR